MENQINKNTGKSTRAMVISAAVLVLVGWLILTPPGWTGKLDAIGYAVCHRISERSFHIGGYQLPLCARCSGMYLGAVAGLVYQSFRGWKRIRTPHWSILLVLGFFAAAFAIDGANSYLYLLKQVSPGILPGLKNFYLPTNTGRLLTGTGMGLTLAALLFPAFNQTTWANGVEDRAIPKWKDLGLLVILLALLDALVLTDNPIVLFPLAVISALGVWLLLTMVYSMVWVLILKQDNRFTSLRQAWVPLLAGLTIAVIQTGAVDALRFWLTGTWGAFPLVN